jgi:hypothetical protein
MSTCSPPLPCLPPMMDSLPYAQPTRGSFGEASLPTEAKAKARRVRSKTVTAKKLGTVLPSTTCPRVFASRTMTGMGSPIPSSGLFTLRHETRDSSCTTILSILRFSCWFSYSASPSRDILAMAEATHLFAAIPERTSEATFAHALPLC